MMGQADGEDEGKIFCLLLGRCRKKFQRNTRFN
jgi:hypothetical protein